VLSVMTDEGGVPIPRSLDLTGVGVTQDQVVDGVDQVARDWRRERPDIDVSSIGIVTRIWRIARHLENQRREQLAGLGTDRGTMDVLAMLRRSGPPFRRSAGELTRSALITSGGVSQRLEKLERAGLITRHVDTSDRRRVDVELTASGIQLVDSTLTDLMDHDTKVLEEALDEDEQELLRRLLRKFLLSLEPPRP
jgi:DNA-binding MarR family transcriptional regulator